jgi:hypothetical protein
LIPPENIEKIFQINLVTNTIPMVTTVIMSKLHLHPYIVDTLMRDLTSHGRKPSAFIVFLFIWARTTAVGEKTAPLSLSQLSDGTGLSKSAIQLAVRYLRTRKLIEVEKKKVTGTPKYKLNEPWERYS